MNALRTAPIVLCLALLAGAGCASTADHAEEAYFSRAELDQMLAPVALYSDAVLSHVLIAATYPLEVVQAARWSREHSHLRGQAAVEAVEDMDWDASVKALVAFPELLSRMDEDIEWTQRLGDAFLLQEAELIASIQALRSRAYEAGHLASNEQVRVVRESETIYIEPTRTRTVYVPFYNTRVVYGPWWWDAYPPVYWHYPRHVGLGLNFYWGSAFYVPTSFYFSGFHWRHHRVVVVNHHHYNQPNRRHRFRSAREVAHYRDAEHWRHNPRHRRGVGYARSLPEQRVVQASSVAVQGRSRAIAGSASAPLRQRSEQRVWAAEQRRVFDASQPASSIRSGGAASTDVSGAALRSSARGRQRAPSANSPQRSRIEVPQARARSGQNSASAFDQTRARLSESRLRATDPRATQRQSPPTSPSSIGGSPRRSVPSRSAPTRSFSAPDPVRPSRSAPTRSFSAPDPVRPSRSVPSRSVPSRSVPSRSVPSRSVPSRSVPSRSVPSPLAAPRSAAPMPQRSVSQSMSRSMPRSAPRSSDGLSSRAGNSRASMPARSPQSSNRQGSAQRRRR